MAAVAAYHQKGFLPYAATAACHQKCFLPMAAIAAYHQNCFLPIAAVAAWLYCGVCSSGRLGRQVRADARTSGRPGVCSRIAPVQAQIISELSIRGVVHYVSNKIDCMKNLYKLLWLALCLGGFYQGRAQTEVTYYTSMGQFKIMLTDTLTPITVDSFKARVRHKFYDGLIFHRVIDNFVIQGGDPLGTGYGGPGYSTPDEFSPTLKNVAGSLAMANSGPNTNGSQFYVNLVNNSSLNNHYTVFGMVTTGFSVVQAIGHVPVDANNKPLTNVYMDSIRITQAAAAVPSVTGSVVSAIYPNPCRGMFRIALPAVATKIEVLNAQGQVVYAANASGLCDVDLRNRAAGLYLVRLANERGVADQRVMVVE